MDKTELCKVLKSMEEDCEKGSSNMKSSDRKRSSDTEINTMSPEGLKIPKVNYQLMETFDLSSTSVVKDNGVKEYSLSFFEDVEKDKMVEEKQSTVTSDKLVTNTFDLETKLENMADFRTMHGNNEEFEENSSLPAEEFDSIKHNESEHSSVGTDDQTTYNINAENSVEQNLDLHKMLEEKDAYSDCLPSPSRELEGITSSVIESNIGLSNILMPHEPTFKKENGNEAELVRIIKAIGNKYEEYSQSFDAGLESETICRTHTNTANSDAPSVLTVDSQAEINMSSLSKNKVSVEDQDGKCTVACNKDLDRMWNAAAEFVTTESEMLMPHNSNLGTEMDKPDYLSKLSSTVKKKCEEAIYVNGKQLNRRLGETAEVTIIGSGTVTAHKADTDCKNLDINMVSETSEDNVRSLPFSDMQFRSHKLNNRSDISHVNLPDKVNVANEVEGMFSLQGKSEVKYKGCGEPFQSSNENSEMSQNLKSEREPVIAEVISAPVVVLQHNNRRSSDLSKLSETKKENSMDSLQLFDEEIVKEQYMPFKSAALRFSVMSTFETKGPHSYFQNEDRNVQMHIETTCEMQMDDEHSRIEKDQESLLLSSQKCFALENTEDTAAFSSEELDEENKTEKMFYLSKADNSREESHDEIVSDDQDLETEKSSVTEDDIGLLGGLIEEDDLLQRMEQKLSSIRKQIAEDEDEEDLEDEEDHLESYDHDRYVDQDNEDDSFLKAKSHNIDISLDPELQHLLDRHLLKQQLGSIEEEEEEGESEDLGTSEDSEETDDIHITDPFKETIYQLDTVVEECESGDENRLCAGSRDDLNYIEPLDQDSENENQPCKTKQQEMCLDYVPGVDVISNCTMKTTDQGVINEKCPTRNINEEQVKYVEGEPARYEISTFTTEADSNEICQTQKYDSCCELKDSTYELSSIPDTQVEISSFQSEDQKERGSSSYETCYTTAYTPESKFQMSADDPCMILGEHQLKEETESNVLLKEENYTPECVDSQTVSSFLTQKLQTSNSCETVVSELSIILDNNNSSSTDSLTLSMGITEIEKPFKVDKATFGSNQKNILTELEAPFHTVKRNKLCVDSWRNDLRVNEKVPFSSSVLEKEHDEQKKDDYEFSEFTKPNESQQIVPHRNSESTLEIHRLSKELVLTDSPKSVECQYFPEEDWSVPAAETDFNNSVKNDSIDYKCNALEAYEVLEKGASSHEYEVLEKSASSQEYDNTGVPVAGPSPLTVSAAPYSTQLERPTNSVPVPVQWQQQKEDFFKSTAVQEIPWARDEKTAVDEERVKVDTPRTSHFQGEIQQPNKEDTFCQTCCDLQASLTKLQNELQSLRQQNSLLEIEVSRLKMEQSASKESSEDCVQPNVESSQSHQPSTKTMEQDTQTEPSGLWKSAAKMGLVIASGLLFFWWITDHLS
ncbi:uncharacterized protein LOC122809098 isoform X2 [Protopterus annectens]|uniref:uncharacterized protein LOC122809098 isoform X2 n=1 Tax=Protopterus annectens TaxID=7888 RepID=UPI001CFAF461|nr:uncharacterized protein LOC122809098 isoform X2 [Protopterus annectens]